MNSFITTMLRWSLEPVQFSYRGGISNDFTWMLRTVLVCPESVLHAGIWTTEDRDLTEGKIHSKWFRGHNGTRLTSLVKLWSRVTLMVDCRPATLLLQPASAAQAQLTASGLLLSGEAVEIRIHGGLCRNAAPGALRQPPRPFDFFLPLLFWGWRFVRSVTCFRKSFQTII